MHSKYNEVLCKYSVPGGFKDQKGVWQFQYQTQPLKNLQGFISKHVASSRSVSGGKKNTHSTNSQCGDGIDTLKLVQFYLVFIAHLLPHVQFFTTIFHNPGTKSKQYWLMYQIQTCVSANISQCPRYLTGPCYGDALKGCLCPTAHLIAIPLSTHITFSTQTRRLCGGQESRVCGYPARSC